MQTSTDGDARRIRDLEQQIAALTKQNEDLKAQLDNLSYQNWVSEACGDDLWDL